MDYGIYLIDKRPFVSYNFLFKQGIPKQTVYNNTAASCKQRWLTVPYPDQSKKKLIDYSSIAQAMLTKYNLPYFEELVQMASAEERKRKESRNNRESKHLKIIFDLEYNSWEQLAPKFRSRYIDDTDLEQFCKTFLLISKCIELKQIQFKLRDLFHAYCRYSDLLFSTLSYGSFCNKIKEAELTNSVEGVLLHGLKNKPSNRTKVTTEVLISIKHFYKQGTKINRNELLKKVNEIQIRANRPTISLSTLKKYISQYDLQNETMLSRYGKSYFENHLMPQLRYYPPQKKGRLWQIDGTKFQFAYKAAERKVKYLTYFIIIDGHTKEIEGYSCDDSENSVMVLEALANACKKTGYLPNEINADRSPAFKHKRVIRFIENISSKNTYWKKTYFPQQNTYAENFFKVFQEKYCKKVPGYIGDGIGSKDKNGKPSPEVLREALKDKNLRSRDELIQTLDTLILEYNQSEDREKLKAKDNYLIKLQPKEKLSPILLSSQDFAQLFYDMKIKTFYDSSIEISINNQKFRYLSTDFNITKSYNNANVQVLYNPKDMELIYIFNMKDQFVCTLKRVPRIARLRFEKTPDDKKIYLEHRRAVNKLRKQYKKRDKEIDHQYNEMISNLPPALTENAAINKKEREYTEGETLWDESEKYFTYKKHKTYKRHSESTKTLNDRYFKKGSLKIIRYGGTSTNSD